MLKCETLFESFELQGSRLLKIFFSLSFDGVPSVLARVSGIQEGTVASVNVPPWVDLLDGQRHVVRRLLRVHGFTA